MEIKKKREETEQAEEKLLKAVKNIEGLEMFCWKTCAEVSLLRFKKDKRKKEKIVAENWTFLQSLVPGIKNSCTG